MSESDHPEEAEQASPQTSESKRRWFGLRKAKQDDASATSPAADDDRPSESLPDNNASEAEPRSATLADSSATAAPIIDEAQAASVDSSLDKTRTGLLSRIGQVFKGSFDLQDELFDELEESLIASDIGIDASLMLVEHLKERVKHEKIQDADGVIEGLQREIAAMLVAAEQPWAPTQRPYVLLMVGVNGVGKTTTTAKIAGYFQRQGKSVMLAAADTFRAAAVAQLQEWGQRLDIPVIAQGQDADAAAVAHDALTSAKARDTDVLIIDTAGRLHTQSDLMEQLQKVIRVLQKIDPHTPHEVMQVLDAGTGQNALSQLQHFKNAVDVSSLCISKLDGSARGGVALALTHKFGLPIRFVGVGEGFVDLRPFNANEYATALLPQRAPNASGNDDSGS